MKHETLYKRTKTGAIQFWKVEVKLDDGLALIKKQSGQLGTLNPSIHLEEILRGKQKRSYAEQADFQALSDWKKKHDEGYKTLQELGDVQARLTDSSVEYKFNDVVYSTANSLLDAMLPKFNTDAAGNVKPMLATDWKKIKKIEYPVYCEPKLDGVRCTLTITQDLQCTYLSRNGKVYDTLGHITKDIQAALWGKNREWPLILDGEVYSDELTFQEIISAVKAQKSTSLKLHFRAYDIVNAAPQTDRRNELKPLILAIGSEFISHITWTVATSESDVKRLHDEYVLAGNEGAILRLFDGKYAQGQRSRELLKVKEFDESEWPIKSFEFGQRGIEDLIAVCALPPGSLLKNDEFRAKMQGSFKQKQELYREWHLGNPNVGTYLGLLTVKHFGLTTDGLPRFPIGKAIRDYE
jgi:ATP-dependent DNA ligase